MRIGAVAIDLAQTQHDGLVRVLRQVGAQVSYVPFVHGAFDSVFSKDNALLVRRADGETDALLARPRHAERAAEQNARASAYEALGMSVQASRTHLEGGDVVIVPGTGDVFLGHGFRSDAAARSELEAFTGRRAIPLELHDERLYHLDMVLTVLEDGTALACLEALTPRSRETLLAYPYLRRVIPVPLEEALRFGVNLVQVGRTIVWGADAPRTTRALLHHGYRVRHTNLSEFHLAGGSAACLVSRIQSIAEDEIAPVSTAA